MSRSARAAAAATVVLLTGPLALVSTSSATAAPDDSFVITTHQPGGPGFAPAFVGNGYLAGRQTAEGTGFAEVPLQGSTDPLPTQSEVQGFYAKVSEPDTGLIERRAALPAWSTLQYDDGSGRYSLTSGTVRDYRQSLDLRTGTLTTRLTWTSPSHKTVDLRFDVTPDRARPHAAMSRIVFTPHFSGPVTITDVLDGQAADLTSPAGTGHSGRAQWVDLTSQGLGVRATVASVLNAGADPQAVTVTDPQTAAQAVHLDARAGTTYGVVKNVGVAVSTDTDASGDPHARALAAAHAEAELGYEGARTASDAAWAQLWKSDVQVDGDPTLQVEVRAAMFALLASTRADVPWAPSPGGLSSDGYNGHVFWDSETWMYPTLLATEPDIAKAELQYRVDRLSAAYANATATGYSGARFPWESALSGAEETPSCCDTGKYEIHVNGDIALAFWQYWLATGDRSWLASAAWPVVSGIADFWVSRSTANADGSRSITGVIPPDEYVEGVTDSVYTNVSARDSLRIAAQVAALTGHTAEPAWTSVADALRIPYDSSTGTHPEYAGYPGGTVKQADVTLLSYPWQNAQPEAVTRRDLAYYVPRTDPNGPSMTDAIHSIVSSQLGLAGCPAYSFTKRSVDPFMRAPYYQFSEARTGGAFTFTTGAGGFVQEFLYGYSGFRWSDTGVQLDPSLPPQLTGVTLDALHWRDRVLKVAIAQGGTTVSLVSGAPVTVSTPAGSHTLTAASPLVVPTRRTGSGATSDVARCATATSSPATAEPAQAAVDGTPTTTWLATAPGTRLTVDLGSSGPVSFVQVTDPPVLAIASTEVGGQAVTRPVDSSGMRVQLSADGTSWRTVATLRDPGRFEVVQGDGQAARYVRVVSLDATAQQPLVVGELTVTR